MTLLFICLGNICRSVAAEGVMNKLVGEAGLSDRICTDSAGLIDYHEGELADERMRRQAARRGINLTHRSRPVSPEDFRRFDLIIAMDEQNIRGLQRIAPSGESMKKVVRMADYLTHHNATHIPDPYYGTIKDFDHVLDLLEDACAGLLQDVKRVL